MLQKDDAPAVVDLLRQVISQPMEDIRQVLLQHDDDSGDSTGDSDRSPAVASSSSSSKKVEELIISKLWMIEKALRGAAEILGDVLPPPPPPIVMSSKTKTNSPPTTPPPSLLSTGRDEILADLARPEDRQYLTSIRLQVAQFLHFFQQEMKMQQMQQQALAASRSQVNIVMSDDGDSDTVTATASIEQRHYYSLASSLRNNLSIQKLWAQLLNLLLTRRMSCLKDVDSMRQVGRWVGE